MLADARFVEYLSEHPYHPRSATHGDALCKFLLDDLLDHCAYLRELAKSQEIVYKQNYVIGRGTLDQWNLDLVIGPGKPDEVSNGRIQLGKPTKIWLAVDAKTVMTEHGKARRNRQRDLNALQVILHRNDARTVVAGLITVNMANTFTSPLRTTPTVHKNISRLVEETVNLFGGVPIGTQGGPCGGIDALGLIVVKHTNIPGARTELVKSRPAPQSDSHLFYRNFVKRICEEINKRFVV